MEVYLLCCLVKLAGIIRGVVSSWHRDVIRVDRLLDEKRKKGPYSGHRPMSANISLLASLAALRTGYDSVIASNEASANEGNFTKEGVTINHQYSKSLEFEEDIQALFSDFEISIKYFSLLRPLHELQIGILASKLLPDQLAAITSCNNGTADATWCMACAKCAFVVLVMTASSPEAATHIWHTQAINTPSLVPYLTELLDPNQQKPFECVGTLEECQLAAKFICSRKDAELTDGTRKLLQTYNSELKNYENLLDYPLISHIDPHLIPTEYKHVLNEIVASIEEWKLKTSKVLV
jgi:hypothetical protein